jgi:hypothetical protein
MSRSDELDCIKDQRPDGAAVTGSLCKTWR